MSKPEKPLARVMSVLNMKGGVGKTTISAHVFREFYKNKIKNVLVIDFDPQFNLTQTLYSEVEYETLKNTKKTILSVLEPTDDISLYNTHENEGTIPEIKDVVVNAKNLYADTTYKKITAKLDILPGDFSLSKYSLIDDKKILAVARSRFEKFIQQSREVYDLICIDCNPSSSFLTVCALKVSTHLLIPVRPDRYSILGLRLLDNFINEFKELTQKPKKIIILNGVPTSNYNPAIENELRSDPEYGPLTMATNLNATKLLEANPSYTGFATDKKVPYSASLKSKMNNLVNELAKALGMQ